MPPIRALFAHSVRGLNGPGRKGRLARLGIRPSLRNATISAGRRVTRQRTGGERKPIHAAYDAARRRTNTPMATASAILDGLRSQLNTGEYKKLHWEGTFSDYLN